MIKLINATDTFPLRRAVLRKNLPNEPHEFNGDFDESTFHLGFYENDKIIGIVTILKNGKIAQLRGMAVADLHQGKGVGKQLVLEAEKILKKENFSRIWMNARENAVPFYEKLGYRIEGDLFVIKPIGFHYLMSKEFN